LLENCRGVRLENITVRHAPMWTIHLVSCIGVTIHGNPVNRHADTRDQMYGPHRRMAHGNIFQSHAAADLWRR
jgi:hypothetical protein